MGAKQKSYQIWFDSEIAPKLSVVQSWLVDEVVLVDFDSKKFFKDLLADLELMSLDDIAMETKVERLEKAIQVIRLFKNHKDWSLYDVAFSSMLQSSFDKILFPQKQSLFKKFSAEFANWSIESKHLIDAYKFKPLVLEFIEGIKTSAAIEIAKSAGLDASNSASSTVSPESVA